MRKREIIRYIKNRDYFTGKEVGYIANVAVSKAAGREGVREMNVKEIVKEYLRKNGYDGLYGEECGCHIDDLMACDDFCNDCEPGYLKDCEKCKTNAGEEEDCPYSDEYVRGAYCIGPKELKE